MRRSIKLLLVAGALALGDAAGPQSAIAQAPAPAPIMRGAPAVRGPVYYPGRTYYSYGAPRSVASPYASRYGTYNGVPGSAGMSRGHGFAYDYSTARPLPLAKPWLRPLR